MKRIETDEASWRLQLNKKKVQIIRRKFQLPNAYNYSTLNNKPLISGQIVDQNYTFYYHFFSCFLMFLDFLQYFEMSRSRIEKKHGMDRNL